MKSKRQLAEALGVSAVRITALTKEADAPLPNKRWGYNISEWKTYLDNRRLLSGRTPKYGTMENDEESANIDISQEKALTAQLKRRLLEVELEKKRGEVVPADEVERTRLSEIAALRLELTLLIQDLPGRVVNLTQDEIRSELLFQFNKILEKLAKNIEEDWRL